MCLPNKKKIALWVGVVFAGMSLIAALGAIGLEPLLALGYLLLGIGISVACGWPLYCAKQDNKAIDQWTRINSKKPGTRAIPHRIGPIDYRRA